MERGGNVIASFRVSHQTMKKNLIKIRHGLRWPPIDKITHKNQPKTGSRDGGDDGGEAQQVGGAGEARYHCFYGIIS